MLSAACYMTFHHGRINTQQLQQAVTATGSLRQQRLIAQLVCSA
jgi:hypothetical protein